VHSWVTESLVWLRARRRGVRRRRGPARSLRGATTGASRALRGHVHSRDYGRRM